MENSFANYVDGIIKRYKYNKTECFNKIKEFIEITKEVGGLKKSEIRFIDEVLTDSNIKYIISEDISCYRIYSVFKQSGKKNDTKRENSFTCGTTSYRERRAIISDRCGNPISNQVTYDRCGEVSSSSSSVTLDRCGNPVSNSSSGSSRGC